MVQADQCRKPKEFPWISKVLQKVCEGFLKITLPLTNLLQKMTKFE